MTKGEKQLLVLFSLAFFYLGCHVWHFESETITLNLKSIATFRDIVIFATVTSVFLVGVIDVMLGLYAEAKRRLEETKEVSRRLEDLENWVEAEEGAGTQFHSPPPSASEKK